MKISCPICETITEYEGEIKKGKHVTCSNPDCFTSSGNRRRIKVIYNVIPSDPSDPNEISPETLKESERKESDPKLISSDPSDPNEISPEASKNKEDRKNKAEGIHKKKKVIPSDPNKNDKHVSRILEILNEVLDTEEGLFFVLLQKMNRGRLLSNGLMNDFLKISLELKEEVVKIDSK